MASIQKLHGMLLNGVAIFYNGNRVKVNLQGSLQNLKYYMTTSFFISLFVVMISHRIPLLSGWEDAMNFRATG
jgi:hypothetical protein